MLDGTVVYEICAGLRLGRYFHGVDNRKLVVDDQPIVHIFCVEGHCTYCQRTCDYQAIPIGDMVCDAEIGCVQEEGTVELDDQILAIEGAN